MYETSLDKRFACGGESELDEVVSVYGEKLLHYATSMLGSYQDAEDVVQGVFSQLIKSVIHLMVRTCRRGCTRLRIGIV